MEHLARGGENAEVKEEEEKGKKGRGAMALGLVVIVRLVKREAGEESMVVEEGRENVTDLAGRDFVEEKALVYLYPVNFAGEALAMRVEERGTLRVRDITKMWQMNEWDTKKQ